MAPQDFVLVTLDGQSHGTQVSHLRPGAGHVSINVSEPQVRHLRTSWQIGLTNTKSRRAPDPGRCTSVKGTDALSDVNGQTKTITLSPLQPLTTYYWRAWVSRQGKRTSTDGNFTTPEVTEVKIPMAVDLGLSVKWASFNIGTESEEDYGGLYGFGDGTGLNRSINNGDYAKDKVFSTIGGDHDYDLATATLGEHWRLPTCKEIEELNQCNPQYRTKSVLKNGVYVTITGWELTGKTGNTIFIPCAGVRTLADDSSIKDRNTYAYI